MARRVQAWRLQLWLGANNRGPLTTSGIHTDDHPPRALGDVVVYLNRSGIISATSGWTWAARKVT